MNRAAKIGLAGLAVGLGLSAAQPAFALLTKEAALEKCRETVGRAFVQACAAGNRGMVEECRTKASPKVRECVMAALNAANGRANIAVEAPKEQGPSADIAKQAAELPTAFVAPPRTITDITAILDSEKPDPARIATLRAEADAAVPAKASRVELARFYYKRGGARFKLAQLKEAIADADNAVQNARAGGDVHLLGRLEQFAGMTYSAVGEPKRALEIFQAQTRDSNAPGAKGFLFGAYRQISEFLIQMGDLAQAEAYLQRNRALIQEARTSGLPGWRTNYAAKGQSFEADFERHRAEVFEARGQYKDAENSYRLAEQRRIASIKGILAAPDPPPESQIRQAADRMVIGQARMKAKQGRLAEAEADARRALLSRLKDEGKYTPTTTAYIGTLASILVDEGRYADAETLMRTAIEINRTIGVADDSQVIVRELSGLATVLNLQHKRKEAIAVYAEIDKATASWDPRRREALDLNGSRINSYYAAGQIDRGITSAQNLLKREIARVGENNYDTASARATLAFGYMKAGRDADAIREYQAAIPVLIKGARENADDDSSAGVELRSDRLQSHIESYIALLNRTQTATDDKVAVETFALADAIRGQSVQKALTASSARAQINDPALAELVRQEQDLSKQVNAQLGTLNNALALPSGQRDESTVQTLNVAIKNLRGERDKLRADIAKRFPNYANLIDPKPPSVEEIKATLKPDEALLSFYLGRDASFVWAVPKEGKVAFGVIPASAGDIATRIQHLRKALEPEAALVSDIPPFDVAAGYELYSLLLKPVEAGWKQAKSLIVVTNGALGLLPLSLLPTAPVEKFDDSGGLLFSSYRNVPWLARTHAVTVVPSAAALRTLRQLPPGPANRDPFIGFGDPYFSAEQAAEAASEAAKPVVVASADTGEVTTRGLPLRRRSSPKTEGVSSAELAQLPRLPDTAAELTSIAKALRLDPAKVLHLGKEANEEVVAKADLSHYRIIDFATHGLVPGELNGLTQPALALTAPAVAGVSGDGLLTMAKILALKLDADWVVLSACNTAAGAGAGAEAASGLGQAFFYAGTRTILVTNWSVHSASARVLVSDLFRRQAADPKLSRAEALRQAMMALLDGSGFVDDKSKTLFSYGHPLFWAPYTIIGDGA